MKEGTLLNPLRLATGCAAFLLSLGSASGELATSTTYTGTPSAQQPFIGSLIDPTSWDNGLPTNDNPGLVTQTFNTWSGDVWTDVAIRQTGGTVYNDQEIFAMRGGAAGSGKKTILEIEDLANTEFAYENLRTAGALTMWSQNGEGHELSLLSGYVSIGFLNAVTSADVSTINIRDGLMEFGSVTSGKVAFNLLAGGTGAIVVGDQNGGALNTMKVNFETGSQASFTLASNSSKPTGSAQGYWGFVIGRGQVSVDGVPITDKSKFVITDEGDLSTTLRYPLFGKWALWPLHDTGGDVDTINWLGWLNVATADWVWSYSLERYLFIRPALILGVGGWVYFPRTGAAPEPAPGSATSWAGWPILDEAGTVDTGDWLGRLNVASGDWVWSYAMGRFLYLPESLVSSAGSWAFLLR